MVSVSLRNEPETIDSCRIYFAIFNLNSDIDLLLYRGIKINDCNACNNFEDLRDNVNVGSLHYCGCR